MAVKITEKVTTDGKKFKKMLEELDKLEVRIGIQEGIQYPDGTSVLDVAMWNELGTYNAPSRPFLRNSVDAHVDEINTFLKSMRSQLARGSSAEEILKKIGNFQQKMILEEINNGYFVPNSDITINGGWMRNKKSGKPFYVDGKKSDRPLQDTGTMKQSIHFVIQEKGGPD